MYYCEPDEGIAVCTDSFLVTPEMLDQQLHFVSYHRRNNLPTDTALYLLHEEPDPAATMMHIYVHVNGMENMRSIEASLDGMADGFSLSQIWRNPDACLTLYDSWQAAYDSVGARDGWIHIDIPTWGMPHGRELAEWRDSTDNLLRMNFVLRNSSEYYCEFNVGKEIHYRDPQQDPDRLTPPDVKRHLYLVINREIPFLPDVPDDGTEAGMDAEVVDWDPGEDIDLGTF